MAKDTSSNGTLGALIEHGYGVHAYCEARPCRHHAELDLKALLTKFGPDQPSLHYDLIKILHCSKCESQNLSFRYSPKVEQKIGPIGPL